MCNVECLPLSSRFENYAIKLFCGEKAREHPQGAVLNQYIDLAFETAPMTDVKTWGICTRIERCTPNSEKTKHRQMLGGETISRKCPALSGVPFPFSIFFYTEEA